MEKKEFDKIMQACVNQFPLGDFNPYRMNIIYNRVKDLGDQWLRATVHQMCLTNNRYFDFDSAARNENVNRNRVKNTEDVVGALETLSKHLTDEGYLRSMRLFGATNFHEAVENCRKYKMYKYRLDELEAIGPALYQELHA